jgi:Protein kinase domain.
VLLALEYLQKQHIAHRDVRSDNLLLNSHGVLKLSECFLAVNCQNGVLNVCHPSADFSNAAQVTPAFPLHSEPVGVIYWQASP